MITARKITFPFQKNGSIKLNALSSQFIDIIELIKEYVETELLKEGKVYLENEIPATKISVESCKKFGNAVVVVSLGFSNPIEGHSEEDDIDNVEEDEDEDEDEDDDEFECSGEKLHTESFETEFSLNGDIRILSHKSIISNEDSEIIGVRHFQHKTIRKNRKGKKNECMPDACINLVVENITNFENCDSKPGDQIKEAEMKYSEIESSTKLTDIVDSRDPDSCHPDCSHSVQESDSTEYILAENKFEKCATEPLHFEKILANEKSVIDNGFKDSKVKRHLNKLLIFFGVLFSSLSSYAQNADTGLDMANTKVRGYFTSGCDLMYAIGAIIGLIGAIKI